MATNPTQQAYDNWQAAKTPWYRQATPTSLAKEREAEQAYTNALRNPQSPVKFGGQPGAGLAASAAGPSTVAAPASPKQPLATLAGEPSAAAGASAPDTAPAAPSNPIIEASRQQDWSRQGMTNAQVAQASPQGRVQFERQSNGVASFSGGNVSGPVSYTNGAGTSLAGAGIDGRGFGGFDSAPAGAKVAIGEGGYAFGSSAAPSSAAANTPAIAGLLDSGNIDLTKRPVVKNADGSISTVRSTSVNFDGKEYLIPTVSDDGRIMSEEEAVQQFKASGKHLGVFSNPQDATAYAKELSANQARMYGAAATTGQPASAPQAQSPVGMTPQAAQAAGLIGERIGYNPAYDQRLNGGGQPSVQNMAAGFRAPTVAHSGNDFAARKRLENMATAASSITNTERWGGKGASRNPAVQAYEAAVKADLQAQGMQPDVDTKVMGFNANLMREQMNQDGATQRTFMQEAGADRRDGRRSLVEMARLGMDQETQGFANRAAAQQEQLRNTLINPNATPEQRAVAQRSLAALAGKTAADRMQTVTLPDTTNDMGQVVRGGQALVRLMEDGTAQQVPVGVQQPLQSRHAVGTVSRVNGKEAVWDGAKWVPR